MSLPLLTLGGDIRASRQSWGTGWNGHLRGDGLVRREGPRGGGGNRNRADTGAHDGEGEDANGKIHLW